MGEILWWELCCISMSLLHIALILSSVFHTDLLHLHLKKIFTPKGSGKASPGDTDSHYVTVYPAIIKEDPGRKKKKELIPVLNPFLQEQEAV